MVLPKSLRQLGIIGIGFIFLALMAGCAAPPAATVLVPTLVATVAPTTIPAPTVPQIRVENAWSQPALLMVSLPAQIATPCSTPDAQFINPCEADGDPMPCTTSDNATAQPAMADMPDMTDTGTRGVVYLTLTNQGDAPDRLIHVESAVAASAGLHQTTMDAAGMMRMRPVEDGLEIPAGGQVTLEPGSYHIMLVDLSQDLALGDRFEVVLTFENSGPITTTAEVRLP